MGSLIRGPCREGQCIKLCYVCIEDNGQYIDMLCKDSFRHCKDYPQRICERICKNSLTTNKKGSIMVCQLGSFGRILDAGYDCSQGRRQGVD